jgi:hypothetical protein
MRATTVRPEEWRSVDELSPFDVEALQLILTGVASGLGEPRLRKLACIVLKVCHVLFHVEARDLFQRLPMSVAEEPPR